jgi:hypothetical protein
MIFKSFPKGDVVGSGQYVFRHYGETGELSRFAQFVEGTLEELTEEDFEGISTLSVGSLSFYNTSNPPSSDVVFLGTPFSPALKRIAIPNTVTRLTRPSAITGNINWLSDFKNLSYIKFPKNFPVQSKQGDVVCYGLASGAVVDCSTYTSVPTLRMTYNSENGAYVNSGATFSGVTVRVPSSLLSSWKSSWANHATNAKYEGV